MEDVLDVYTRLYDPNHPQVCFDESSKQLIAEKIEPLPAQPGKEQRYDYQYERNGVCNLFMFFEPLAGWRHVEVTNQRTAIDKILKQEIVAWEEDRNNLGNGVDWRFTTADARIKLKRLYPSIQN